MTAVPYNRAAHLARIGRRGQQGQPDCPTCGRPKGVQPAPATTPLTPHPSPLIEDEGHTIPFPESEISLEGVQSAADFIHRFGNPKDARIYATAILGIDSDFTDKKLFREAAKALMA